MDTERPGPGGPEGPGEPEPPADTALIPVLGDSAELDVAGWNLEWFGSPDFDPADDSLQLALVQEVIQDAEVDVWALVEVVGAAQWRELLAALPGYDGVLATDPAVEDGTRYYRSDEQKPALLYRKDIVTLLDARVVLTKEEYAFAGRPPLELHVRSILGGTPEELVILVLHMKAGAGAADRDRREEAAAALKTYLDQSYPDQRVLVVGDFNDDVDTSIHSGSPTPYAAFVADSTEWVFPTAALSAAGVSSTTGYPDMVDHQLYSDEMMAGYVAGSAEVVKLDEWIDRYDATTSDHYPVLTSYRPPG